MAADNKPHVSIYTDGAAEPNPGPGGYGVVLLFGEHRRELSCGFEMTTNNRMELLAVIAGLEALTKPCRATVYSDSRYVVDSVENGSVFRWRDKDWWRTKKEKAKNTDLWKRLLAVYEQHDIVLKWVPGHIGIPENERCDELALASLRTTGRLCDIGYEPSETRVGIKAHRASSPKITHVEPGEACRICGTAIIKRTSKRKKRRLGQTYYYEWYLFCPGCKARYMVEAAKRDYHTSDSVFDEVD